MGFQSVPDTAQFTAHFIGPDNTKLSFALYSRNTVGPWDSTQMGNVASDFSDAIVADYLPLVSTAFTFVNVTSRDLEPQFGRVIEHDPVNAAGGLASPALPNNVAVVASFIGEPGAAPRRGRIFLLPPGESQVVGNLVSVGALAQLQDAAESLHNAMSLSPAAHVIVSRSSGWELAPADKYGQVKKVPTKRAVAVTNTVPTVIVRNRVDSQRRRSPAE